MVLWILLCACTPRATPVAATPEASQVSAPAQTIDPLAAAAQLRNEAIGAHQEADYPTFLAKTREALRLDPDDIVSQYNLACGLALTGDRPGALTALRALLDQSIDFGAGQDPDFASLDDDPEFQTLIAQFGDLFPEISHGTRAFDLGDRLDLAPEGIAHDPATGRFFVGSTRLGAVFSVAPDGTVSELARLVVDGVPVAALGLEVDAARNRLWAVGTAFAFHEGFLEAHRGVTGVFGLDLDTGEILDVHHTRIDAPFGFNDVTVGADGTLYLSGPGVWVVRPGAETPEPLGEQPPVQTSNGITLGPDGTLYVAADRRNITAIDPSTLQRRWLELPAGVNLRSFDGLYHLGDAFVGIQLGLGRWRVVRVDLDATGTAATGIQVLEQSNPRIAGATTGAVDGDDLVVITRAPVPDDVDRTDLGPAPGQAVAWRIPIRP
ncbi:MAG: hypothetical protein KTR31_01895 [Myxococcales bacterium]|nr:hypothetical protein [Myxococcales bacterium]